MVRFFAARRGALFIPLASPQNPRSRYLAFAAPVPNHDPNSRNPAPKLALFASADATSARPTSRGRATQRVDERLGQRREDLARHEPFAEKLRQSGIVR